MSQSQPLTCLTIKANARIRRSRQWKDQSENQQINIDNAIVTPKKKNSRRKRRPTKKEKQQLESKDSCDGSTATASTAPSSDDSLSGNCNSPTKKSPKKSTSSQRRKRSKKNSKASRPKVVNIPAAEPTPEEKANYVALDAEMVGIGPGGFESRLARVSLVDWDGNIIYDKHVQVVEKVTDYRTFVSGITEEDLVSDDAVTFDEAQTRVSELLEGKILVGHGLKNDFKVLGISHPWYSIRDTAKYEPFMKTCDSPSAFIDPHYQLSIGGSTLIPKKLKVLAKDKLGMIIQEEGKPHSPVEDAEAALELYKKHRGKWEKSVEWKLQRTRSITQRAQ